MLEISLEGYFFSLKEIEMNFKFSVIVPTYNRAATIERALNSLINQTHQNFEVIVVDDGSVDTTVSLVESYLLDERFKLIKLPENCGVNKARNTGLDFIAADSDWVTFLDSDDEFTLDALQKMSLVIKVNPLIKDFCFSVIDNQGIACSQVGRVDRLLDYNGIIDGSRRPKGEFVHTISSDLIRNRIFRYEERVRNGFEIIAYFRLARKHSVLYSCSIVRRYFLDGEGLTRTKTKKPEKLLDEITGFEILMNEFGEDLRLFSRKEYSLFQSVIGFTHLQLNNLRLALQHTKLSFLNNYFELRVYRNLLLLMSRFFRN